MLFFYNKLQKFLDTNINELLDGKTVFVNNNNQHGGVGYAEVVNQLSEKLISLYERQIKEKDELIEEMKAKLKSNK